MRFRIVFSAALVGCLAMVPMLVDSKAGADADRCEEFAEASRQRAAVTVGSGADVLVVGDSYSVGLGVDLGDAWPTRLPGEVRVEGFSGSGFSRGASPCGDVSYARRAGRALRPGTDLVVVQGGLNDHDRPPAAIEHGYRRLIAALSGHRVVVVGPPPAPARVEAVPVVDALLSRLAREHGVDYLSMRHAELPYLPDELHLTPAGHRSFGDAVADFLTAEGLATPCCGEPSAGRAGVDGRV